jgi:hypothetical protein
MDDNTASRIYVCHHHHSEFASQLPMGNRLGKRERTDTASFGQGEPVANELFKITKTPMHFACFLTHALAPGTQGMKALR